MERELTVDKDLLSRCFKLNVTQDQHNLGSEWAEQMSSMHLFNAHSTLGSNPAQAVGGGWGTVQNQ